jgi:hypothetical protein
MEILESPTILIWSLPLLHLLVQPLLQASSESCRTCQMLLQQWIAVQSQKVLVLEIMRWKKIIDNNHILDWISAKNIFGNPEIRLQDENSWSELQEKTWVRMNPEFRINLILQSWNQDQSWRFSCLPLVWVMLFRGLDWWELEWVQLLKLDGELNPLTTEYLGEKLEEKNFKLW